jgi:hypothetical protein
MSRRVRRVAFQPGGEARLSWEAWVDGERWHVRVNEVPTAAHRYTLLVDGVAAEEFDVWPGRWTRPPVPPPVAQAATTEDDPYERREYEVELERFERSKTIAPLKLGTSLGEQQAEPDEREQRDRRS